ncbi:HDOD domain-containing protein [Sediminispirochaeta smaragdinae]|uniref:Metal dependent phosphohydrolase n=1 Tax=Sediminispirochaeta smaragdinae (strain DSM 11293 / JCM 15392 / SEBR 4228) TaxID=573413 RepID=E1RAU6_SEDSS|nr:HDOD domain-containing protein [Sediminispirochaeta smaragdinae]ADK79476.1 metal dependent phosphohydrolase [Sediminispirochaeta smaragdinae DSM 11293]
MAPEVNVVQIQKAARNAVPIAIKTYTLPRETEVYLEDVLGIFLSEFGQEHLKDRIAYCLKELSVNAKKANTKRVYFKEKELDINNARDYSEGMKHFKEETLSNIGHFLELQKQAGLYIKVVFQARGKTFTLSVKNNVEISKKEQIRVYDRIARSRAFETMEEALSTVLDDSEGAGLGIVILVLMLKKLGLDEDAFDIDTVDGETVARITIPFSDVHIENLDKLSEEVVSEINELPQFPDNIVFLQKLINDPDSEITDIARQISTDPSLTADLLKVVNSAQFMLPKRVDNIVEAVKLVGLRGLKNLLYSYGTQKILSQDQKWLWDHSYRTAFYAYSLARSFKKKKDLLDDAYVGGILHDMGKIVFAHVHPKLLDRISNFCTEREIDRDLFEDLSAGLNHAEIGGRIAEKWNFPATLVEAIRFHHEPSECDPEYRDVVETVYLANALANLENGEITFEQIDPKVLAGFHIRSEEQGNAILQRLSDAFSKDTDNRE